MGFTKKELNALSKDLKDFERELKEFIHLSIMDFIDDIKEEYIDVEPRKRKKKIK